MKTSDIFALFSVFVITLRNFPEYSFAFFSEFEPNTEIMLDKYTFGTAACFFNSLCRTCKMNGIFRKIRYSF